MTTLLKFHGRGLPIMSKWPAMVGALFMCAACAGTPETAEEAAVRRAAAATTACAAILERMTVDIGDYRAHKDAKYALEVASDSLQDATSPDALAVRDHLRREVQDANALAQTGDTGAMSSVASGHRLLVDAARACDRLGAAGLRQYLLRETGSADYR